jgi:hypothetical protein
MIYIAFLLITLSYFQNPWKDRLARTFCKISKMNDFLKENIEKGEYNQYWYSNKTISCIVDELIDLNGRTAFLSTPSLYFSLPFALREKSNVFDVRNRIKQINNKSCISRCFLTF